MDPNDYVKEMLDEAGKKELLSNFQKCAFVPDRSRNERSQKLAQAVELMYSGMKPGDVVRLESTAFGYKEGSCLGTLQGIIHRRKFMLETFTPCMVSSECVL